MLTDFVYYGTWRLFTDWPYCTVPEEGKLIKYSHQISPPLRKEFWVFLIFPRVLTIFLHSGTWRMFIDCPCCTVPKEGKLIKYSHQNVPSTQKGILDFSEFSDVRFNLTSHGSISPRVCENNIFHLAWKKFPKKSRNKADFINKVTLYESPKITNPTKLKDLFVFFCGLGTIQKPTDHYPTTRPFM